MLELNRLYNLDCMQGMKEFPDGFFDLAIVDPPYGIGIDGQRKRVCTNPKHNRKELRGKAGTRSHRPKNISESLNGYHKIKSYGAGITLFRC